MKLLPDYNPPTAQRACVAVGTAPLLVLIAFTCIVARAVEPDIGFAVMIACTIWVIFEMNDYQHQLDRYNADYIHRHLDWRTSDALRAMLCSDDVSDATRDFVAGFIAAGRRWFRDRPTL